MYKIWVLFMIEYSIRGWVGCLGYFSRPWLWGLFLLPRLVTFLSQVNRFAPTRSPGPFHQQHYKQEDVTNRCVRDIISRRECRLLLPMESRLSSPSVGFRVTSNRCFYLTQSRSWVWARGMSKRDDHLIYNSICPDCPWNWCQLHIRGIRIDKVILIEFENFIITCSAG